MVNLPKKIKLLTEERDKLQAELSDMTVLHSNLTASNIFYACENEKLQARVDELERAVPSAPPCKCRSCANFIPEGAKVFNKPLLSDMCGHVDYQSNLHTRSICGGYLSMTTHERAKPND